MFFVQAALFRYLNCLTLKQAMLSPSMTYAPLGLRLKFKHLKFFLLTSFIEAQIVYFPT